MTLGTQPIQRVLTTRNIEKVIHFKRKSQEYLDRIKLITQQIFLSIYSTKIPYGIKEERSIISDCSLHEFIQDKGNYNPRSKDIYPPIIKTFV